MELKVMVDGIQRVISGVTVDTTCKDIVLCLAQANKQFGKFILIEKWRNNERLLSPNEHPIEVLNKLGEYANDVQFIMKRSDSLNNYRTGNQLTAGQEAVRCSNGISAVGRSMKKCLAFTSPLNSSDTGNASHNHSSRMDNEHQTASQLSAFDCANTSVTQHRPKHPPPYDEAVAKSSLMSKSPPIAGQVKASQTLQQVLMPPRNDGQSSQHSPTSHNNAIANNKRRLQGTYSSSPSTCPQKTKVNLESVSKEQHQNLSPNKVNRNMVEKIARSNQRDVHHLDEERHRDAIKLINLQKETMATQKQELMDLESELSYWDNKLKMEDDKLMEIEEELRHLERIWIEQEAQLSKWDQQRTLEQIEELQKNNELIEAEKIKLKSQINENDSHIANCRQRIQTLMEQLGEFQKLKEEEVRKEREEYEKRLLFEMKQELREKCNETERLNEELNFIKGEFAALDELMTQKVEKCNQLIEDIKEANLEGLCLLPREDTLLNNGGILPLEKDYFNDRFHQRPGSTRRMYGSPRQLENAVATNKNPHGVWV